MNRRSFLLGGAACAATVAAPWVITTPGLLMPVKKLWTPPVTKLWVRGSGTIIVRFAWSEHSLDKFQKGISEAGEWVEFADEKMESSV